MTSTYVGSSIERKKDEQSSRIVSQRAPCRWRNISSRELFEGGRQLVISHGDDHYLLRITSKGKLILTK